MKNVKIYLATLGLATALSMGNANAVVVRADEDVKTEDVNEDVNTEVLENEEVKNEEVKTEDVKTEDKEETTDGKQEFGDDDFIDLDNWSEEIDADPEAGAHISEDVVTEAERKGLKPKPEEPPPEQPHEEPHHEEPHHEEPQYVPEVIYVPEQIVEVPVIPKTGENAMEDIMLAGAAAVLLMAGGTLVYNASNKSKSKKR